MITVGMRISPLQSLLTALVPDNRRGLLMGLAVGLGQAGIGLGSFAAGLLYGPYGYLSNTVAAALAMGAMALLVWKGLPEPDLRPRRSATPAADATQAPGADAPAQDPAPAAAKAS
jgi:predicted MFS family arabinose efflux permease